MRRAYLSAITAALLLVLLAPMCALASHDDIPPAFAHELSRLCRYECSDPRALASLLTNGTYGRAYVSRDGFMTITAPEGESIAALYLCWRDAPASYTLERREGDGWTAFYTGQAAYLHTLDTFAPVDSLRVRVPDGGALRLDELRAFTCGTLPQDVQRWQPTYGKCDLLLLVAHPDDELLFFGGLLPWYAAQGKHVLVATMTCRKAERGHELLDALWRAGIRHYPSIGRFTDRYTFELDELYDAWMREDADYTFVKLVREHQPDVIVSHSTSGEYGHAAHKACADIALRMFDRCADALYLPQLSHRLGVWQPKKLYLHQYRQNELWMDWSRTVGGIPAARIADEAFKLHRSQKHFTMYDSPDELYCNAEFGLALTTVGLDQRKDDFFENIVPE